MTIYIRNKNSRTIVDMEIYQKKEEKFITISTSIIITEYSNLLLDNQDKAQRIIDYFSDIDNIRQWYWENYIERQPSHTLKEVIDEIEKLFLEPVCKEFGLYIVTD